MQVSFNLENPAQPGKCMIYQFQDSLMDSREILEWMWQPREESPVNYLGP